MESRVYTASFDGTQTAVPVVWPPLADNHLTLVSSAGSKAIKPYLSLHTNAGAIVNAPLGWIGTVTLTLVRHMGPERQRPIVAKGRATFTNTASATFTWSQPLGDVIYEVMSGKPVITEAAGPVACCLVGSALTDQSATIIASAEFTGYVDVIAWQPGADLMLGVT